MTNKEIHEARIIRDAEVAHPGIVRQTLNEALVKGEEPTKANVKRAALRVIKGDAEAKPATQTPGVVCGRTGQEGGDRIQKRGDLQ